MIRFKKRDIRILELIINKIEWEKLKKEIIKECEQYYLFPKFIDIPSNFVIEKKHFSKYFGLPEIILENYHYLRIGFE